MPFGMQSSSIICSLSATPFGSSSGIDLSAVAFAGMDKWMQLQVMIATRTMVRGGGKGSR